MRSAASCGHPLQVSVDPRGTRTSRRPLTAGEGSERLYGAVRRLSPAPDGDRPLGDACEGLARWVLSSAVGRLADEVLKA